MKYPSSRLTTIEESLTACMWVPFKSGVSLPYLVSLSGDSADISRHAIRRTKEDRTYRCSKHQIASTAPSISFEALV